MNKEFVVRPATNDDCENVQNLVFCVLREYGLEPDLEGTDRDLTNIKERYINRGGLFEIIEDQNGKLLGTVGLYPIDSKTVELRKMYFDKELRGRGLGKLTLQKMIGAARELGFEKIVLETASVLKEAIGLYESFGFKQTNEKHTPRCDVAYYLEI